MSNNNYLDMLESLGIDRVTIEFSLAGRTSSTAEPEVTYFFRETVTVKPGQPHSSREFTGRTKELLEHFEAHLQKHCERRIR